MRTRLDPDALAALAAVVGEGSFERAAARLHVTPSAVSQRIRALEERCGAVLVVRGQPCTATPLGRRLCRHAERLAALDHELARELVDTLPALALDDDGAADGRTAARPTLRIAVNADSLATWFVPALAAFAAEADALVQVTVDDETHTAEALRRGEVLAAVCARARPVQGCRVTALGALRYRATASPDFMARHFPRGVGVRALAQAPCLRFDRKDELQALWVQRVFGRAVTMPQHALPSSESFVQATLLGLGWALNPEPLVAAHLAAGRLVELKPGTPLDQALFWQASRLAGPALAPLTRAVRAAADSLVPPR
jgi:LysR family transcriptional regulator (chromosome initiation inhibitor)